jgi:hypothetical protein
MSSSLDYSCNLCNYTSNSKYNYHRHMNLKHSDDPKKFTCDLCDGAYTSLYFLKQHKMKYCTKRDIPHSVTKITQSVTELPHSVTNPPQNVTEVPQIVTEVPQIVTEVPQIVTEVPNLVNNKNVHTCHLCTKEFNKKYSLTRHIKTCKGTKSSLECYRCHIMLPNKYTKHRHLQKCCTYVL